ncbi:MAG TPA: energy transducer TonB [Spirochaetota bacterium]|nr:energy transducer TonB [Spirochaetota bacterium]HOL56843.1 energy transducer TonB [Spirochaetota bacterium]HPP04404.1 energy transducer TonB [Spirochaetota bacterium]
MKYYIDNESQLVSFLRKHLIKIIVTIVCILYLCLFLTITITLGEKEKRKDNSIFKIVDVKEFTPPEIEKKEEIKKEDVIEINRQESITENVVETDKKIVEVDIDYLPQHKISKLPELPAEEIKSRIVYPPLANKQGIEGIVYLELFIDQNGIIRKIEVLKDPGYGFAEAAIKALQNIKCKPAEANGIPVAVRYRYPIRFTLKK